jgi:2-oxoisovalerate dehydrogenase E1 component alpha subunit
VTRVTAVLPIHGPTGPGGRTLASGPAAIPQAGRRRRSALTFPARPEVPGAPPPADGTDPATPVQLLRPDGTTVEHPDHAPETDPETLRSWYRDLVLVRRFDAEATALQRQGQLGLWAPCLGQEAAQIGSGRALAAQDHAFPTYREHGVAWCRGVDPVDVLRMFRGTTLGGWDPERHGMHLYTIVIGSQVLHAAGYAMGVQRDGAVGSGDPGRDTAVIAYFGDGASSQGDVNEAFTYASVFNAPVVFFCQNNQLAISEPNERQFRVPLYQRARGFGFPGVRVDGNDVLAVHAVTRAALDRARSGEGPMLIEAYTYRMGAHTTSDDPTRYRQAAEVDAWRPRDPITRFATHLRNLDAADDAFFAAVDAAADDLAADIRARCLALPDPASGAMFDHVYAEPHPLVESERAWLADWERTLEPEPAGGER